MPDVVDQLRAFKKDLDEYNKILEAIWQRAPGHGWFGAATEQEHARVEQLRDSLAEE